MPEERRIRTEPLTKTPRSYSTTLDLSQKAEKRSVLGRFTVSLCFVEANTVRSARDQIRYIISEIVYQRGTNF